MTNNIYFVKVCLLSKGILVGPKQMLAVTATTFSPCLYTTLVSS